MTPLAGIAPVTRRTFVHSVLAATFTPSIAASPVYGITPTYRYPLVTSIASGDPHPTSVLLWAHIDIPPQVHAAYVHYQWSLRPDFAQATVGAPQLVTPATDGTVRIRIHGLTPGKRYYYRITASDDRGRHGPWVCGHTRTAPVVAGPVRIVWSGDVCGQGWGINPHEDGLTAFRALTHAHPDVFIHNGDAVYADNPLPTTVHLPDGRIWKNIVTPAKTRVAQSLTEFRGQYAYHHHDKHYRHFSATIPQIVQWDDHEVLNNWFVHEYINRSAYTPVSVDVLAHRALRAFCEWQPIDHREAVDGRVYRKISYGPLVDIFVLDMRSYKESNAHAWDPQGSPIFGEAQTRWLIRSLNASTAVWKIISNDLPLGIVVDDTMSNPPGPNRAHPAMESISQGDPGQPLGREIELAHILKNISHVPNVLWITTDVHYSAALHFHPDRASFTDFRPFWQFVSGPLHAGAFPAHPLDMTFGPDQVFVHAPSTPNSSPLDAFQHFGQIDIDPHTHDLTVTLLNTQGTRLYTHTLHALTR